MILKVINAGNVVCPKKEMEVTLQECKMCKKFGGAENTYTEIICNFKKFDKAPEVQLVARDIIEAHHRHLVEAKMLYLFRFGTWKVNRKIRGGSAEKCSGKIKFLTGADFIITINGECWPHMDTKTQCALVDHELCHCGKGDNDADGNPTWYIEPHTVEDFAAVIRRHGLWGEDIMKIAKAMKDNGEIQLEMFGSGLKLVNGSR